MAERRECLRDIHMAEEKAENGERAKENDENISDKGEKTGISKGAMIINQRTANERNKGFANFCLAVD